MMLPVGVAFDILDVAERAAERALVRLERMGLPLGPVAVTPEGRAQFFVASGSARALPGLLYRMGWDDADLDLRPLGPGTYITAPPSDRAPRPRPLAPLPRRRLGGAPRGPAAAGDAGLRDPPDPDPGLRVAGEPVRRGAPYRA
ncbi:hypothetical protein ACFQVA_31450 [Actinomadura keratinilytica]